MASQVPCDIVNELENNAEAAEQFVREIQAGQVPTLIENLPSEVANAFGSMINVALSLPETLWDTAEGIVDGVENLFDSVADGSIVTELPEEIAETWETVTAGLVDAWDALTDDIACLFGDCAEPTPGGCNSGSVPASAVPSATSVSYYNTTSAVYSYNWALSSAVAAASAAAYAQATASESSLQPAAVGTSIVFIQPTYSATPSSSSQAVPDAAPRMVDCGKLRWLMAALATMVTAMIWL